MKKNILIYPFIFLLILLISILFGARINLNEVGIKSTSILTVVNSITKRSVDKFLETKVKLKSNSQTKSIIDSKQKKQNDSLSDESKEFYVEANSYKENFFEVQNSIDRDFKRDEIYKKILENTNFQEKLVNSLNDFENLLKMDSNEQAKYRVFVLEFLRAKYKEVNIDLVKNLAQSLMIEYLKQGWKKSRDLDLVDAFTVLIKNEKNRNPYFNPEDFVESLNYNNTFQKQLDLAILYAYKDQKKSDVEEEQWSKILKEN